MQIHRLEFGKQTIFGPMISRNTKPTATAASMLVSQMIMVPIYISMLRT
jgi:hypothetical protein